MSQRDVIRWNLGDMHMFETLGKTGPSIELPGLQMEYSAYSMGREKPTPKGWIPILLCEWECEVVHTSSSSP